MNTSRIVRVGQRGIKTLAVVGIITAIGWISYGHKAIGAAAGRQTYTTPVGGFSFSYPTDWTVSEGSNGAYDQIMLAPASTTASSAADQFMMTLLIAPNPDVAKPPVAMANGTTTRLPNGINLWVSTTASALRTAAETDSTTCPELEIANKDQTHLSYPLPNGLNLALMAGYCEGQASTASLTYQQQLAQGDWLTAVSIIKSIQWE